MKSKRTKGKVKTMAVVLASGGLLGFLPFSDAGDLEPSDPPGPTVKILEEIAPMLSIRTQKGRI
jgi:hypothetical protein